MSNMFNYRRDRNSEMITSIPLLDREIYLKFFDKIFKQPIILYFLIKEIIGYNTA